MTYWNVATKTAVGALALVAAVVGFDDRYAKAGEMAGKLDGGLYARDMDQYREDEKERRASRYIDQLEDIEIQLKYMPDLPPEIRAYRETQAARLRRKIEAMQ